MSQTFSKAVAAAIDGHTAQSWDALLPSERSALIYAEMRKIEAESVQGRAVIGDERQAA